MMQPGLSSEKGETAQEFTAEGLPFEVRLNNFYGLRLMNGENPTNSAGGPGRCLESIGDVITPTSMLARETAERKGPTPARPAPIQTESTPRRRKYRWPWKRSG